MCCVHKTIEAVTGSPKKKEIIIISINLSATHLYFFLRSTPGWVVEGERDDKLVKVSDETCPRTTLGQGIAQEM